jgi:uncharacterized membrane protein
MIPTIPPADLLALTLFSALWLGYGPAARWIGRGTINTGLHSAPNMPPTEVRRDAVAEAIGGVLSSAILTFTDGIRSYYFAIAGLAWLAGPWWLMGAELWLVGILFHRQIGSKVSRRFKAARAVVEAEHGADQSPPPR